MSASVWLSRALSKTATDSQGWVDAVQVLKALYRLDHILVQGLTARTNPY